MKTNAHGLKRLVLVGRNVERTRKLYFCFYFLRKIKFPITGENNE